MSRPRLFIDRGSKESDLYEYQPIRPVGRAIPSFDIGKKHFGVYVHDEEANQCVYAGLWKLGDTMTRETQERLTLLLERLDSYFKRANVALVERQRSMNYMAVRLEQHVLSFLELRYPSLPVVSVPSDLKYRQLDGPLGDQKGKRKQWAVDKACEFARDRGDLVENFLLTLEALKRSAKERELKGDDVADAFIQLEAWKRKRFTKAERKRFSLQDSS